MEGTLITPTLRLVAQLGQGGMGSVWIADHLGLHTQVVVKFMAERLINDPKSIERFSREAAAAAQIKSPHVAQVFDHGVTTQGIPYIVMELLEGHDLGRHLRQNSGYLPPNEVAVILAQLAKALGKAHERGIVHRDIKPDNIFLCDPGSGEIFVKLLDFGIAKSNDAIANANQTNTGAVMGTPYYMSPEQMVGAKHVDHRSDLWSLGVVAYFCITGSRPFTGDTYGALAIAIHSGPMPAPSALNPMLSPAVDAWFFKACARDPNQRFSSARELAEAFAAATGSAMGTGAFAAQTGSGFVATGAAPAAPTGAPLTSTSPETVVKKRSSAGLFAGIGVVLLLVLGVGGFFLFGRKEPTPATPAGEAKEKPEKLEKAEKPAPSAKASASEEPSAAPAESVEELPAQADPVPSMKKPKAVPSAAPSMAPSIKAVPKPKGKYDDDIK